MKSVLISIQPKWVEKIASGEKTIEVRKAKPKIETPFKCYIYETKGKKVECGFHFEETGRTLRDKYVFGMKEARIVKHYCNEGNGKVIGEFVCDSVIQWNYKRFITMTGTNDTYFPFRDDLKATCLSYEEFTNYGKGKTLYGWHISNLVIYDKPKELNEFTPFCKVKGEWCDNCIYYEETFGGCCLILSRPPQSWCYVEEVE